MSLTSDFFGQYSLHFIRDHFYQRAFVPAVYIGILPVNYNTCCEA